MTVDPPEETFGGLMSSHNNNTSELINHLPLTILTRGGQQIMPPSLYPSNMMC